MRDFNQGDDVTSMTLEHYPGMTESYLDKICEEAKQRWDMLDCLIVHRVGEIHPMSPSYSPWSGLPTEKKPLKPAVI